MRHAWLRKGMLPAFSPKLLLEYEPTIQKYIRHFTTSVSKSAENNGDIVDISKWFEYFSFDVFPVSVVLISGNWSVGR